jgi:hypothetical protein
VYISRKTRNIRYTVDRQPFKVQHFPQQGRNNPQHFSQPAEVWSSFPLIAVRFSSPLQPSGGDLILRQVMEWSYSGLSAIAQSATA